MAKNTIVIFMVFTVLSCNGLQQQTKTKLSNESKIGRGYEIEQHLQNSLENEAAEIDPKTQNVIDQLIMNKIGNTEYLRTNQSTIIKRVNDQENTNQNIVKNISGANPQEDLKVRNLIHVIIESEIKKSNKENDHEMDDNWVGNDLESDSEWDKIAYDSYDDDIEDIDDDDIEDIDDDDIEDIDDDDIEDIDDDDIEDIDDDGEIDFVGVLDNEEWKKRDKKLDEGWNGSTKPSFIDNISVSFDEDDTSEDRRSHEINIETSNKNDSKQLREILIKPQILIEEAQDFFSPRTVTVKESEDGNVNSSLRRVVRDTCEDCYPPLPCHLPKFMVHSELHCKKDYTKFECEQKCVFGYTLKEGTKRVQVCDQQRGIWSPSPSFVDCQPFIDCTIRLKPGGKIKCYSNYMHHGSKCNLSCKSYADNKTVETKLHTCNIKGQWEPELPHCARSGTGQRLIPRPEDDQPHTTEVPRSFRRPRSTRNTRPNWRPKPTYKPRSYKKPRSTTRKPIYHNENDMSAEIWTS